jgi:hypothetical protein
VTAVSTSRAASPLCIRTARRVAGGLSHQTHSCRRGRTLLTEDRWCHKGFGPPYRIPCCASRPRGRQVGALSHRANRCRVDRTPLVADRLCHTATARRMSSRLASRPRRVGGRRRVERLRRCRRTRPVVDRVPQGFRLVVPRPVVRLDCAAAGGRVERPRRCRRTRLVVDRVCHRGFGSSCRVPCCAP